MKRSTINSRKRLIVLTTSSLLIGSLGVVSAQSTQNQTRNQTQAEQTPYLRGFGPGFGDGPERGFGHGHGRGFSNGFGGLPFGLHLALGTTVTLEFYDTDPGTEGASTPQETLTFTYGQDSEAAFSQSFTDARANAGYLVVIVGEQTQTLELPSTESVSENGFRGRGHRGALPLHGLNEGSSVTATFYDGDPAGDAQTLQTLTFSYGQDSEAGFAADFASAAENAAFVTLTTSPQTTTLDLSASPFERGGFGGYGERDGKPGRFR